MAITGDIKAIKGTDNVTYNLRDDYSVWGGENLLLNIPKSHNSANYLGYQFNLAENLIQGQRYTMQLWDANVYHSGKTAAQHNICVYWGGGGLVLINWGSSNFTAQTNNYHADYLKATFTAPTTTNTDSNNLWFNIYNSVGNADGTRSMSIGKWKLEKGDKATDWTPCYKDIFTYNTTNEQLIVNL